MAVFEIPLTAEPQEFSIRLSGTEYTLALYWNEKSTCWMLNILSAITAPVLLGIPVITGLNILAQYDYLGIAGSIVVQTSGNVDAVPTFDNLGDLGKCFYVTAD